MSETRLTVEEFGQTIKAKYPQYAGMSDREIGEATLEKYPEYQNRIREDTGFVADIKGIGTGIKESAIERSDNVGDIKRANKSGEQGKIRSLLQTFGQGAGFASDIVGETIIGAIKALTPQGTQEKAGEVIQTVGQGIAESQPAQEMVEWYNGLDPKNQRDVDATLGTLGLALDVAGGVLVKNSAKGVVTETIDSTADAVKGTVAVAGDVAKKADDVTGNIASGIGNTVADIPRRTVTNFQNAKLQREAIEALPTETGRRAVRDGIDINDVSQIYKVTDPNTQASFKKLHQAVKEFEGNPSASNPIEMVGKPIVTRLKTLDAEAQKVGKELSTVADDLGDVTAEELNGAVMARLNGVRGMEGLKVGDDGLLDFSDTVLASNLSKADQNAINEIFAEATRAGSGKSKHLLRQELFEILNGKKQSLQNITGTQERAYQAVRQGLADVLDGKNADYKRLNQEYATIITPVTEMRKMMRQLDPDIDEDILDMSAGLLARRLTSNSASNPKIRLLLRQLDEASAVDGKTTLSVEQLQDFYNILERYYDIQAKTGFQAQISTGIEKTGIVDQVLDQVRKVAGRSDPVRQKALEDLILETYGQ